MVYVIFECRKCGHNLYVLNKDDRLDELGDYCCPYCDEDPEGNWIFLGTANDYPYDGKGGAE